MYLKHVSFVKPTGLQPGSICALPLRGKLVYGMIGTTEDEFKEITTHFIALRDEDAEAFGGHPLVNVLQMSNTGVFHISSARFVPEVSEFSLRADPDRTRYLGIRGDEIFFCLIRHPFQLTFSAISGADSNTPIRDMIALHRWKIEADGKDGQPVLVFQC